MNEKVMLDLATYNELVKKAERIDTIKRMIKKHRYMTFDDVLTVLGVLETEVEIDYETI